MGILSTAIQQKLQFSARLILQFPQMNVGRPGYDEEEDTPQKSPPSEENEKKS